MIPSSPTNKKLPHFIKWPTHKSIICILTTSLENLLFVGFLGGWPIYSQIYKMQCLFYSKTYNPNPDSRPKKTTVDSNSNSEPKSDHLVEMSASEVKFAIISNQTKVDIDNLSHCYYHKRDNLHIIFNSLSAESKADSLQFQENGKLVQSYHEELDNITSQQERRLTSIYLNGLIMVGLTSFLLHRLHLKLGTRIYRLVLFCPLLLTIVILHESITTAKVNLLFIVISIIASALKKTNFQVCDLLKQVKCKWSIFHLNNYKNLDLGYKKVLIHASNLCPIFSIFCWYYWRYKCISS